MKNSNSLHGNLEKKEKRITTRNYMKSYVIVQFMKNLSFDIIKYNDYSNIQQKWLFA